MVMEMKIGDKIKKQRRLKGWTQKQLGDRIGVSSQVISNWEREYTQPDHDDVARLAEVLDVSADYLLGRNENDMIDLEPLIKGEGKAHLGGQVLNEDQREIITDFILMVLKRSDKKKNAKGKVTIDGVS